MVVSSIWVELALQIDFRGAMETYNDYHTKPQCDLDTVLDFTLSVWYGHVIDNVLRVVCIKKKKD